MVAGLFYRHAGMSDDHLQRLKQIRRRGVEFAALVELQAEFPRRVLPLG